MRGGTDQLLQRPGGLVQVWPAALGRVTDDRPARLGATTAQHAPLHRADVLCLVHQHVREGVVGVGGRVGLPHVAEPVGGGDHLCCPGLLAEEQQRLLVLVLLDRAQHGDQLVQQGRVGHRPVVLVVACCQRGLLGSVEDALPDAGNDPRRTEAAEHVRCREVGPPCLQEHLVGGGVADQFGHVLQLHVQVLGQPRVQRSHHGGLGSSAPSVGLGAGQHVATDPAEGGRVQRERLTLHGDPQRDVAGNGLEQGQVHQPLQQRHHPEAALDRCSLRTVDADGCEAQGVDGYATDRTQHHRVLTEGREHAFDVVHEQAARPDDEDPAALEPAPVGVQQVRSAVQRNDRLAGAGTARDDRDARVVGADRLVLLSLDGGDDVAHAVPAGPLQGGHQRTLADDHELVGALAVVEEVVLDAGHDVVAATQHPSAHDVHRLGGRRPVEGLGCPCPPVDDQRLVLLVAHADASDVADLPVGVVEPPEDEALVLRVEGRQSPGCLERERIAFEQRRAVLFPHVALPVGVEDLPSLGGNLPCRTGGVLEVLVDKVDVRLLDRQFAF